MDSLHEAHLTRILEGRRRRGVLGEYSDPVVAPPPQRRHVDPPPPPPPAPRYVSSTTGTQTFEEQRPSAAAQTKTEWGNAASDRTTASFAKGPSQVGPSDWRQSFPRNGGGASAAPVLTSPRQNATQEGAVRFQSPGRVPSLAYSTPASTSPRRRSSPVQPPFPNPSLPLAPLATHDVRRSVEPLPPPLYIPRPRSTPREPPYRASSFTPVVNRWPGSSAFGSPQSHHNFSWQPAFSSPRPVFDDPALHTSAWRNRSETNHNNDFTSRFRFSPLSIHREESAAAPLMAWPSVQREASTRRRQPSRRRSHHRRHRHHHSRRDDNDDGGYGDVDDEEAELPSRRRSSRGGAQSRAKSRQRSHSSARPREDDPRRGRGYAPPVVYMSDPNELRAVSPSSAEGTVRRRRSSSPSGPQPRRNTPVPRSVAELRKTNLGLPDARSTMDLRTSIETLRAGDWFYKWSAKGDVVHRRWVWVDTKSYLLVWSNRETRNANFCGDVRLDHVCQVTSRDLISVDEDGFPKTYYVLLIETTKRVLQLATELKDKCDAWFEALNNVMGFIHRNDIAKGALMPD